MTVGLFPLPPQAICAIRDGLSDTLVRTGHKLALHQRAVRMKESASFKKYCLQLRDLPSVHVQDVKHVSLARSVSTGMSWEIVGCMSKVNMLLAAGHNPRTAVSS